MLIDLSPDCVSEREARKARGKLLPCPKREPSPARHIEGYSFWELALQGSSKRRSHIKLCAL